MIRIDEQNRLYLLHTAHTTYQMKVDETGRLLHLYYGPRTEAPAAVQAPHNDPGCWPDLLPQEWPAPGKGDNHAPSLPLNGPTAPGRRNCGLPGRRFAPASTACPVCPLFTGKKMPGPCALPCGMKGA